METSKQCFDCLCRTCMNEVQPPLYCDTRKPEQQWVSIFDIIEECGSLRIAELISNAVPQIKMQLSDDLPTKICCQCLQQLLSAYRFQEICIQSEEKMLELVSKKRMGLKLENETGKTDPHPCFHFNSTSQSLQHTSIQETLTEIKERTIEPDVTPSSAADHSEDVHENLMLQQNLKSIEAMVKNEPIEDEPNIENSDDETINSPLSVKDEILALDSEEQQINVSLYQHNCHLCNKSFKESNYLKKHLRLHERKVNSGKYCYSCDLCGKTYSEPHFLRKHRRMQHSIDEPNPKIKLQCEYCDKSFRNSFELRRHVRTHTGERPFSCPECGKSFSDPCNLKSHIRSHGEDKPYECPHCPLRFTSSKNMSGHKKIHKGIDRKLCDICGKSIRKSDLQRHKLIHSDEKPHVCDLCGKRFLHIESQRRHMRTHTGEKPFKCKYCDSAFGTSSILVKHLRLHLGDNVYRCEFCPLGFPLATELRLHLTTHNKNEDPETRERNMKALKEEEAKLKLELSKKGNQKQSTKESLQ
ncbi:zinc finger protein 70-like [Eurosta solidaginis]|uniref:zinc finger protein 70-like n=1 Tax=Eurosta solidaginis TaxID=178769 RepID=UPI0035306925